MEGSRISPYVSPAALWAFHTSIFQCELQNNGQAQQEGGGGVYSGNNSDREQKPRRGFSPTFKRLHLLLHLCFEARHSSEKNLTKLFFVFFLVCESQCFLPPRVEGLVRRDSELIGRLHYKEGHDLYHWRLGWFTLEGSALRFSPGDQEGEEEVLQLKQLQELSKHVFLINYSTFACPL